MMSFYFWLGIEAEDIDLIEDDGFITTHGLTR